MGASANIGDVLAATYKLERVIGRGGMGEVYEAVHVRLPRRFAIKFLHSAALREPSVFERFRREAEIASSIGHPNILDVMDFNVTDDGLPYMVSELLEGEELAHRIERDGAMPLERVWAVIDQAAAALHAAHGRGVVHRDLKPQNIFLVRREDRDDFVKVLDFGISKVMDSTSVATRTGVVFGTLNYMSPEQANGLVHEIDARTDVFALGAIAYEMLAGQRAFDAPTPAAILQRLCYIEPEPLPTLRPELPPDVATVIATAMSKAREERFESMAALRDALRHACGQPSLPVSAQTVAAAPPALAGPPTTFTQAAGEATLSHARPRKPWGMAIAAAGVTVLAVVLGVALTSHKPAPVAPATRSPVVAAAPAPAPPAPAPVVEVRVTADPPGASLALDGRAVTSPLRAPRSDAAHRLRIEAPGYAPVEQELRFDRDSDVRVALSRVVRAAVREAPRAPEPAPSPIPGRKPAPPAPAKPGKKGPVVDTL